jgi:Uma2 family endonuclease
MVEYLVKTKSIGGMTEDQFFDFCQENDTLKLERNAKGEIIIMSPTGNITSWFNSGITAALYNWNKETKSGIILDSNAGITLPNGAVRSPDGAFIPKEKWNKLALNDKKKFAHICPDFILEIRSESDSLEELKEKMNEYMDNGCILSWLIDPKSKQTFIYRKNGNNETIAFSKELSGEDVMPDFKIDLSKIFSEEI